MSDLHSPLEPPGPPSGPPPPGTPAEPARGNKPLWKRWWFIAVAAVIVLVAVVGATADPDDDAAEDETSAVAPAEGAATTAAPARSTTTAPATTSTIVPTTTTAPRPTGSQSSPLPHGQVATVGDYAVTVVSFNPNATAAVLEENQFNEPPPDGQTYALVRLRVRYEGEDEGNPWVDLTTGYVGSDARAYTDPDCPAVEPDGFQDQPTLFPSGESEANFCLLLPQAVVGTGAIFVEPSFSFDASKVWWQG